MLVHIGGEISVLKKNIIAILNIKSLSKQTLEVLLNPGKAKDQVINIDNDQANKSLILLLGKIYLSPISANTLQKRASE